MFDSPDLHALFARLNALHFDGALPPCCFRWSRRLTRTAGTINVQTREIVLSLPLLLESFENGQTHTVCGVLCVSSAEAVRVVVEHEMIHLWLFERGLPHGHTKAFRTKSRAMGHGATRHAITRPAPRSGWRYECAKCGHVLWRQRQFGRAVACRACCQRNTGGAYDVQFRLHGQRVLLLSKSS